VRDALQPLRDSAAGQWVLRRYAQDRVRRPLARTG
jgi:hypothetical protein